MANDLLVYKWTCPICGATKQSLAPSDRGTIEAKAENALLRHVRTTNDEEHGRNGETPPDFDPSAALDHIQFMEGVDDQAPDVPP